MIRGPLAISSDPIVAGIFGGSDESDLKAEFGIGAELPYIDGQ
jgi:hypothetical protein